MSDESVTRRAFIGRVAVIGAAIGAAPVLAACGKKAGEPAAPAPAGPIDCSDITALTDAEKKTRADLQYVEASAKPDQSCTNCEQYAAAADAATCGACTLVPGPINPTGWCLSWVQKIT